jgi:hypothetical protein
MCNIYSAAASCGKPGDSSEQRYRATTDGPKSPPDRLSIKVRVDGDDETAARDLSFEGRDAWALTQLLEASNSGCTPIDNPAPRWSHYIYKLRRAGIVIETIHEAHGGPFAGYHARYVLRSRIRVIEISDTQRPHLSSGVRP